MAASVLVGAVLAGAFALAVAFASKSGGLPVVVWQPFETIKIAIPKNQMANTCQFNVQRLHVSDLFFIGFSAEMFRTDIIETLQEWKDFLGARGKATFRLQSLFATPLTEPELGERVQLNY
jgi:hypothetical protein